MLQASTDITHYDESIWGVEGHPASEFWAERHVRWVEKRGEGETKRERVFERLGGPNDFFPYGELLASSDAVVDRVC